MALKKLTSAPVATDGAAAPGIRDELKSRVLGAAPKAVPVTGKKKRVIFRRLSDAKGRWVKILMYGQSGTGKTDAIRGFLKAGLKVLVISTDLGGDGLSTVYNNLQEEGLLSLGDNLVHADFPTWDDMADFLNKPESYDLSDLGFKDIYAFDPDIIVWEGFSGFQLYQLDSKVLDMAPNRKEGKTNVSEQREAGLVAEQTDWGAIKRGTIDAIGDFMKLHNHFTGKAWHKYMTCLESEPDDKNPKRRPLLQGAAGKLLEAMFDIIIEAKRKEVAGSEPGKPKIVYSYNCVGHDGLCAKSRGYKLDAVETPDMLKLWTKIKTQIGDGGSVEKQTVTEVQVPTSKESDAREQSNESDGRSSDAAGDSGADVPVAAS